MAYIVFFLGLVLAGSGGYALYSGFDDLTTERGLALTLSGTIGVSIGLVIVAISFGLWHLSRIGRKLDDLKAATNDLASEISQALSLPKETEGQVFNAIEDAIFAETVQVTPSAARNISHDEAADRNETSQDSMLETVLGLEDTYGRRPSREASDRSGTASASNGASKANGSDLAGAGGLSSSGRLSAGVASVGVASAGIAAATTLTERGGLGDSDAATDSVAADASDRSTEASPPERNFMESEADINRLIEELSIGDMSGSAHPDTVNPDFAKLDSVGSDPVPEVPPASFDLALLEELGKPTPASTPEHPILELNSEPVVVEPAPERHSEMQSAQASTVENEVIGSYESAGVTYTLYADGSVVAESGQMREFYPSLEALRTAFERGESVFGV